MAGVPLRPIAPTSFPGMPEINSEQAEKTYENADFGWDVDWPPICRAVALYGCLLILIGIVQWMALTGVTGLNPSFTARLAPFAVGVFMVIGGVTAEFLDFTEEALALIGGAATAMAMAFTFTFTQIPSGYPLLTNPGPYGTDFAVVLSLLVVGAASLVVGLIQSIGTFRASSRDEQPREVSSPAPAVPGQPP
jgi:hypothetical protein